MKSAPSAIALIALVVACHTQPAAETPQSVSETPQLAQVFKGSGDLDFAAGSMSVAGFLGACQELTGVNFTYTMATSTALQAAKLQFEVPRHVQASDVATFISSTLDAQGFAVKPIGPEHLRVLLVERKRS